MAFRPLNLRGLRVSDTIIHDEAYADMESTHAMLRLMAQSDRLSTTIRFTGDSTELDSADYANLELLAQIMQFDRNERATFYFLGFSDSVGSEQLNLILAAQRAEIVRQALVSRYPKLSGRITARATAFGELLPLGCNETRPGREINRRVEVWIERPVTMAANSAFRWHLL